MLLLHDKRRADSRADWTAGSNSATRTPMIAITTSNSTKVNAYRGKFARQALRDAIGHLPDNGEHIKCNRKAALPFQKMMIAFGLLFEAAAAMPCFALRPVKRIL